MGVGGAELDADRLGRASSKPSVPSDSTEEEQHKGEKDTEGCGEAEPRSFTAAMKTN